MGNYKLHIKMERKGITLEKNYFPINFKYLDKIKYEIINKMLEGKYEY